MKTAGAARMQATILPGGRLHLHDGPIDLIILAEGSRENVRRAYVAATRRFASVLDELCAELALLRSEMSVAAPLPSSPVARRMDAAVRPLCGEDFITRMAAVAGSVADEILSAMCAETALTKAFVNNGGDIAVHLSPGAVFDIGMVGGLRHSRGCSQRPHPEEAHSAVSKDEIISVSKSSFEMPAPQAPQDEAVPFGTFRLTYSDPARGVATSGFGGRSFSLGIADAVTVLANTAAAADAAATVIANAVDLPGHPAIARAPATDFDPQSDLGGRLVTRSVGQLTPEEIAAALDAGVIEAQRLIATGRIVAAALSLRGAVRTANSLAPNLTPERSLAHVV